MSRYAVAGGRRIGPLTDAQFNEFMRDSFAFLDVWDNKPVRPAVKSVGRSWTRRHRQKKSLYRRFRRPKAGTYAQRSISNRRFSARIKMNHMLRQLPKSAFKFARLV